MSERRNETRRRTVLGVAFVLHGLAHTNAGMLAADGPRVLPTIVWAIASVSFIAAGFGLLGVRHLYRHWQVFGLIAIPSSLVLLAGYQPATAATGVVIDLALLGVMGFVWIPPREWTHPRTGRWATIGRTLAFAVLGYVAVTILSRPWHSRWGSSDAELRATLPGDDLVKVVLAPFGLLVFEPAHFIMERRMLLGIKERAERLATTTPGAPL